MFTLVKKKPKQPISLQNHQDRRNKILIKRRAGGYGDILMQRMIFEDFSKTFPDAQITFACPAKYLEMAKNHPYAQAVDIGKIKEEEYGIIYDITTVCRVHECRYGAENRKHRSDIWAEFCGVKLSNHEMYLTPNPEMIEQCNKVLAYHNPNKKPVVLLASQSTKDDFGTAKSLNHEQVNGVVDGLRKMGFYVCTVHNEKQWIYDVLKVDQFTSLDPQAWIALVSIVDYIISVDTATFHLAGGLKKPTVGIYTFTDGATYSKYYNNTEIIQGNCPFKKQGCFNLDFCPKEKNQIIPCKQSMTSEQILNVFSRLIIRFPLT